jgi:transposase
MKQLEAYRDKQNDSRLKMRFLALLMVARGIKLDIVALTISKSLHTIEQWFKQYVTKDIDSLHHFQYKPKKKLSR